MKKPIIIILFFALLSSCETLVEDFKIKKPEDRITLNGFAMADSVPVFYLTSNLGLDEPVGFPPITDADVELLLDGTVIENLTLDDEGWYTDENYSFITGNEYSLHISAPGYDDVSADFSIPAVPQMTVLDTNLIAETYPDCPECSETYRLEFEIEFLNEPGIDNYYSVEVIQKSRCVEDEYNQCEEITSIYDDNAYLYSNVPYIEVMCMYDEDYAVRTANEEAWGSRFYFSDRLLDEGNNLLTFQTELMVYGLDTSNDYWLTLVFKKIDEHMFEYAYSKGRNSTAENNPFVQPVSIYTNVENGLGLVSGSSQIEYSVDLTEIISNIDPDGGFYKY